MEGRRIRILVLLSLSELLAMSLWFVGSVIIADRGSAGAAASQRWLAGRSWLTIAVQLGFVAGALASALFSLSDHFRAPRVFAWSAILAAMANLGVGAGIRPLEHFVTSGTGRLTVLLVVLCRGLTGVFLAGVYPTGMKIMAGWFRQGRGLALGILIGALTIGSASPHLLWVVSATVLPLPPGGLVLTASVSALLSAVIVAIAIAEGPYAVPQPPFDWRQMGQAFRNRELRLANLGYLGHMWELYSMWSWIAVLLAASQPGAPRARVELAAFAAIAIGFLGCAAAGWASDRISEGSPGRRRLQPGGTVAGRARVTELAMAVSGSCAVAVAVLFTHPRALMCVVLVWGIFIIADSAQFSAAISELADPRYVGTALTTQVAFGFLLTAVSIRAVAAVSAAWGWRWAAVAMAPGPVLGAWAMRRLEKSQLR
ncbi:MAG: MFS transporter [Acidobacteria bacterium]|nr:MFS transporter [Acidobacteriota bacterium]